MKRIIAAHDLSGVGVASLSAAMPILSASGLVVHALPTAVLSTITGVFKGFAIVDLTDFMRDTITHWQSVNLQADYIYSGFLGSAEQGRIIEVAFDAFPDAVRVVDPAFADNGKIYETMGMAMVEAQRKLVAKAHIVTPNVSEAMFLLDKSAMPSSRDEASAWCKELCDMGCRTAVITGVECGQAASNAAIDTFIAVRDGDNDCIVPYEKISANLHGTGDVFTSALIGALSHDIPIYDALKIADAYIGHLIRLQQQQLSAMSEADAAYAVKLGLPIQDAHGWLIQQLTKA